MHVVFYVYEYEYEYSVTLFCTFMEKHGGTLRHKQ